MKLLENYKGKYLSALPATDKLDIDTIFSGCDEVLAEADKISDIVKKIDSETSVLDSSSLSIDGKGLDETFLECLDEIENIRKQISDFTANIKEKTVVAYNNIQRNYNAVAKAKDKELGLDASKTE